MTKKVLVCVDRDGTLTYDDNYHLGRTHDWEEKLKILPNVEEGIKVLNKIENSAIYIATNQPGIAVKNFGDLTEERAGQVCQRIIEILEKKGAHIKGYFVCPKATPDYVKKRKEFEFKEEHICYCSCIKPDIGIVLDALEAEKISRKSANIYVIGDRLTDVLTGINASGVGILIPFKNKPGEAEKVKEKFSDNKDVYIAKDFLDAAKFIENREQKNS